MTSHLPGGQPGSVAGPARAPLNILLIPGTASVAHLFDNLAAEDVALDDQALRQLDGVSA